LGVRIALAGRLGGAEMSRNEEIKRGRVPLQTCVPISILQREQAYMTYGTIGIKVWIYRGEVFDKKEDARK
jgi:small subunit ribosomal protein S3